MVSFKTLTAALCLYTSTLAAPLLQQRDAGTQLLIKDLLVLDQAIRNVTYAAGNYTGDQAGYQRIRDSFAQVNTTNRVAYHDAMTIAPRI